MTEDERDKVAQDTLYWLIELHTLVNRISEAFQYPIQVRETPDERYRY